ncbi:hypothetical protein KB221_10415 [Aquidulcibacter paucihalophilus]|jgi:cytochrome bd-type quinol oxidase subunit 2|nr:hypothetical protein KB221_10415 [Aquidulcibacter paucihalophilus]
MTQAVLFMAILPLALLLVLLFVLISGHLSERARVRIQWALMLTVYPVMILHFGWQAWERQQRADWLEFSLFLAAALIFALQLVQSVRSGTLFPRFRSQRA